MKRASPTFLAVLVPCHSNNDGPTDILSWCGVALFLTPAALWLDSLLLICF